MPSALRTDRSARRAFSRDAARKHARPGRNTATVPDVAALVHQPHLMPYHSPNSSSGQTRVNAKRNARREFWRTVKIRVSAEMEPYFRKSLHLLGAGSRIDGRVASDPFWLDLNVHIPGAPAKAARAMPVFQNDWTGDRYVPRVLRVDWYDANDQHIERPELVSA